VDALVARMRELLAERMDLTLPFPPYLHSSAIGQMPKAKKLPGLSPRDILKFLDSVTDPEQVADLVSCAVLQEPAERQTILETLNVETRLQQLIQFLLSEQIKRKN
jgi:ATP-dependent Lon protease